MQNQATYIVRPERFRDRLYNLKVDAALSLTTLLEDWRVAQERPDAIRVEISENSRTHIQPINSLGPDAYITIVALSPLGVWDEDDNFFGWDDLGHENDIINVAEYADGIRMILLGNNPQIMIENILYHSANSGECNISAEVQSELAAEIIKKLRKESQLNPFGRL